MLGLVHDGLVTFDHTSGPQGLQLVPDLAISIPPPSASATVFRFRLRPGIRYSNGAPVRASDFRRAFRRVLVGRSPGTAYFGGIIGAPRCISEPGSCTLRRGVVVDDALGTVTFHLSSPDPDFPFRLAAADYATPVPRGTPLHDTGMSPILGTGPYRIVSADVHEIRLERNPLFHEWSYAAQPAGNPNAIVWRFGLGQRAQVAAVRNGDADWTFQGIPARMVTSIRNHDAARLHVNDQPQTDFLMFRATAPPFDDVRVRRALNLAIDRGRIAAAYGGPDAASTTCQMLPPGETARVPFCPFTRDPRPDGTWSAPDLARARRLVNRSGTRGDRVTVLGVSDDPHPSLVASRAAARALTTLGYRVRLRVMSHSDYNGLPAAVQASLQVFPFSWYADFPSPATFFQTLLPCRPRPAGTCKQVLSRRTQKALQQEAQGRGDQVALWSAIDRRATRQAFTVPLVNPRSVELTSKRLSGYEYNPLWGFLPAQAAVGS
jgi:peptide/nickel transport system substrate-binding protein